MKQWRVYHNKFQKAQALIELAIFGSIVMMLFGVLISYGLRYDRQLRTIHQTFRKALKSAAEVNTDDKPILVEHVVVNDSHVPDPTNTFGIGSVSTALSQASLTRTNRLFEQPDNDNELPVIRIDINDQTREYKAAGFREVYGVTEAQEKKYIIVYGANNLKEIREGCAEYETTSSPDYEYDTTPVCLKPTTDFRIIDTTEGEIVNYNSALNRCKMITDTEFCKKECIKDCRLDSNSVPDPECQKNCEEACPQEIEVPWYCAKQGGQFVILNSLFPLGENSKMGLQQDYSQIETWQDSTSGETSLHKQETNTGITTTDNLNWNTQTKRTIVTKPFNAKVASTNSEEISTNVSQKKTFTWSAPW